MSLKGLFLKIYDEKRYPITFDGDTVELHAAWKEMARKELVSFLKLDRVKRYMTKNPPTKITSEDAGDFVRTKYSIETFESVEMPYYVLEPKEKNGCAALAIHGHGSGGKMLIAGIMPDELKPLYEKYGYTYGIDLVKMGYVVYIPDLLGSGERTGIKKKITESSCDALNQTLAAMGLNLQGFIVAELMRMTEIIHEDDFTDVTVCGFSGGGLFALLLGALDPLSEKIVCGGYLHSYKGTILENNFCGCNYVPELWKRFDVCDYAAMTAPKRLAVEVGDGDPLNRDAAETAEYIKKVYSLYDEGKFVYKEGEGAHKWFGTLYDTVNSWNGISLSK